ASTRALLPDHAAPRAPSRRSDPPTPRRGRPRLGRKRSGEGGIRTHGDHKATPVFETGPFNRSGTSPVGLAGPFLPAVFPSQMRRRRVLNLRLSPPPQTSRSRLDNARRTPPRQ